MLLWCSFNASLNSSTRCELAAAIIAVLAPQAVNIAIDNANVVKTGNEIMNHAKRRENEERRKGKSLMLGGKSSVLHRSTPYKKKWSQIRDGGLWELFEQLIKQRGPRSVRITKVKRPRHPGNGGRRQGKSRRQGRQR